MAAFVRDSYLDVTMVSRREARSLESWVTNFGLVMEAVTVAMNRGVFSVLQSAVILVRVGAARKKMIRG